MILVVTRIVPLQSLFSPLVRLIFLFLESDEKVEQMWKNPPNFFLAQLSNENYFFSLFKTDEIFYPFFFFLQGEKLGTC